MPALGAPTQLAGSLKTKYERFYLCDLAQLPCIDEDCRYDLTLGLPRHLVSSNAITEEYTL